MKVRKYILEIFLGILIGFVCLSFLSDIFTIPVNRSFFVGSWDEPFAINGGINATYFKGVPKFFMYGGTTVYPFMFAFLIYESITHIKPVYQEMNKNTVGDDMPGSHKIYPVKPIYVTKVVMTAIYTIGYLPLYFWRAYFFFQCPIGI